MEEKHFVINENTPPDLETSVGKWWLCEKGQKYDIWRFDSKKKDFSSYVIIRRSDGKIVADDYTIESIGVKHDLFERTD